MVSEPIFHCSLRSDWQAAQAVGEYIISSRGRTLADEGFIHACYSHQIDAVLARFYGDVTEPMCLLRIDPGLLTVPVVAENLLGGDELFPHIYGPLPVDAVDRVQALRHDATGWRTP